MVICKLKQKRPEVSHLANNKFLNYVNFLAFIFLAFDWFKNNQLLSELTHAHYRDTVPLRLFFMSEELKLNTEN